jgi:GNAT superfamily N-acetyltransferase
MSITIKESEIKSTAYKLEVIKENKVIGRAYLYLITNDLHPSPYGLLEDVFIEEEYRGQGIGKELVKKVIEMAKQLGCYKLIATSRFDREKVHKFYEELGFKRYGYEFRIDLNK